MDACSLAPVAICWLELATCIEASATCVAPALSPVMTRFKGPVMDRVMEIANTIVTKKNTTPITANRIMARPAFRSAAFMVLITVARLLSTSCVPLLTLSFFAATAV